MKPCGCSFCNDLRNIESAKYIGGGDAALKAFIKEAVCFTLLSRRRFNITRPKLGR